MKYLTLTAVFVSPIHAALVIEETFSYDAGNLNGRNGGTGFSSGWSNTRNNPSIVETGLTAGSLASGGGTSRGNAWSGTERQIGSSLSNAGLTANGSALWFSAIFDLTNMNVANADLSLSLGTSGFFAGAFGDRENLASGEGIGITHSRARVQGVYWSDSDSDTIAERVENDSSLLIDGQGGNGNPTQALIVGRIDWGSDDNANETLTLYAPSDNLTLGSPIMAAWEIPALDQSAFDRIAIQYKDNPQVDEIRFGSTSADVLPAAIPEPSSTLLLALGALGLICRRR